MEADLILCNPKHLIYPLWNQWMIDNRDRFEKVIICLTDMAVEDIDYSEDIKKKLATSNVTFIDIPRSASNEDWREKAIKMALNIADADWVIFMEQDFFITDSEAFWTMVECPADNETPQYRSEVIGVLEDTRLHPCFLAIKRTTLNKTHQIFAAHPPRYDHFGQLQVDLEEMKTSITYIQGGWRHMNGLSQNLYLLQSGGEPNYRPEEFKEYCQMCLQLTDLHPDWEELFRGYLGKL